MALKDLAVSRDALNEVAIEEIILGLANYDPDAAAIVLTPTGAGLRTKEKILVHLVALMGWPFVVDDHPATSAKPLELEAALGIPGGSLRPALKELSDQRLVRNEGGAYSIQVANLATIKKLIGDAGKDGQLTGTRRSQPKKQSLRSKERPAASPRPKQGLTSALEEFVRDGFFSGWRSLADIMVRLQERGITVPVTSVSGRMLELVRRRVLVREKQAAIWLYKNP